MCVLNILRNLFLMMTRLVNIDDSEDSEPIVWFKRTKSTIKVAEQPRSHGIKTTTSPTVPLNVPLPGPQTHSSGPTIILPLLDDTIDS